MYWIKPDLPCANPTKEKCPHIISQACRKLQIEDARRKRTWNLRNLNRPETQLSAHWRNQSALVKLVLCTLRFCEGLASPKKTLSFSRNAEDVQNEAEIPSAHTQQLLTWRCKTNRMGREDMRKCKRQNVLNVQFEHVFNSIASASRPEDWIGFHRVGFVDVPKSGKPNPWQVPSPYHKSRIGRK